MLLICTATFAWKQTSKQHSALFQTCNEIFRSLPSALSMFKVKTFLFDKILNSFSFIKVEAGKLISEMLLQHLEPSLVDSLQSSNKKCKNSFFSIAIIIKEAWAVQEEEGNEDMKLYDYCNFSLLDFASHKRYLLWVRKGMKSPHDESGIMLFSTSCQKNFSYLPHITELLANIIRYDWEKVYLHIQRMLPLLVSRQVAKN